jgi:hypothetical protein
MKLVRRRTDDSGKVQNHLTMGWLLEKIKVYSTRIIAKPDSLLCESDIEGTDYLPPTLDGSRWTCPELFSSILQLEPCMPHLCVAIRRMFTWGLEKWVSFASEYAPGSQLSSFSDEDIADVWIPTTTDAVEGKNGSTRVNYRRAPNMSELVYNARNMVKKNNTSEYIQYSLQAAESPFLHSEARRLLDLGLEKLRRESLIKAKLLAATKQKDREVARAARQQEQRRKEEEAFKGFVLEETEDNPEVLEKRRKDWLELQLLWHRRRAQDACQVFPAKSTLRNNLMRAEKLSECIKARKNARDGEDASENVCSELEDVPNYIFSGLGRLDSLSDDEDEDLDAVFALEEEDEE